MKISCRLLLCVTIALFSIADITTATDFTWNGLGSDNNWTTPGNWTNNLGFPNAATDRAIFTGINKTTLLLNGNKTVAELIFTNSTVGWNISGDTLTLPAGGKIINCVDNWPNGGTWTFSSALNLLGDAYFSFPRSDGNTRTLSLTGQITGSNTIYISANNASLVSLSGNNTGFLGNVICLTGKVAMANANAFGTNSIPVEIRTGVNIQNPSGTKPLKAIGDFGMSWAYTYNGPIELLSNATFTVGTGGGNACTINSVIFGNGNVVLEENARLTGTSANAYTGTTTCLYTENSPILLNKTAGLDAVPGDMFVGTAGGAAVVQWLNSNQVNDSAVAFLFNSSAVNYGGIRLNGFNETIGGLTTTGGTAGAYAYVENNHATTPCTLTISNNVDRVYSGQIRNGTNVVSNGALSIVKTGSGTWFFNGIATNTGTLAVSGGTLGGTGAIACAVTVADGATINPGTNTISAGTLTISSNLTLSSGCILQFDLGPTNIVGSGSNDLITGVCNLDLNGTVNVFASNGISGATYRLINYTGIISGNGLTIGTTPLGYAMLMNTSTVGQVDLVISKKLSGMVITLR